MDKILRVNEIPQRRLKGIVGKEENAESATFEALFYISYGSFYLPEIACIYRTFYYFEDNNNDKALSLIVASGIYQIVEPSFRMLNLKGILGAKYIIL